MDESKVTILGKTFSVARLGLKGWTVLEGLRKKMDEAISKKDFNGYFLATVQFIEMASISIPEINWVGAPWNEVISAYSEVVRLNSPTIKFPILSGDGEESKPLPWEYEGRSWYFWLNLFALNYGWHEKEIAEMDVDTAIGLYQEITIYEQFDKEWTWGLSEVAYPYNSSTKTQNFKPLDRPNWMKPIIPKQLPVVRMRKDFLPMGLIVDIEDSERKRQESRKK